MSDEVDFLYSDEHESLLQVEMQLIFHMQINIKVFYKLISKLTLVIKVSYKAILSLLMGMIKHSRSTQTNKIVISLKYLKKGVRNGVHFLHADKHQSFYKLALLFLMEGTRHVEGIQNSDLVILLQYIEKKVLPLFLSSIVMQNTHIFYGGLVMFFVSCCYIYVVGWLWPKWAQPLRNLKSAIYIIYIYIYI